MPPPFAAFEHLQQLWRWFAQWIWHGRGGLFVLPMSPGAFFRQIGRLVDPDLGFSLTGEQLAYWAATQWWMTDWSGRLTRSPGLMQRPLPHGLRWDIQWHGSGWSDGVTADGARWALSARDQWTVTSGVRLWPASAIWAGASPRVAVMPEGTLDHDQHEAVRHHAGPRLVLAPAGSGKTTVLTHRIARVLSEGIPGERILALTFTVKAATEMRTRLRALVGAPARAVTLSTYHALAYRLLGAPDVVADDMRQSVLRHLCQRVRGGPPVSPDHVDQYLAAHARRLAPLGSLPLPEGIPADRAGVVAQVAQWYLDWLETQSATDFDGLMSRLLDRLRHDAAFRQMIQHQWWFVLIDEYQDNAAHQDLLARIVAAPQGHLFWVGDDDQVLYSFRDADVRRILALPTTVPGLVVQTLQRNYRSVPGIVACAQSLIRHNNPHRFDKAIQAVRRPLDARTVPVQWRWYETPTAEVAGVVAALRDRHAAGVPWGECAVLLRTHTQIGLYAPALAEAGIPFHAPPRRRTPHPLSTALGRAILAYWHAAQGGPTGGLSGRCGRCRNALFRARSLKRR